MKQDLKVAIDQWQAQCHISEAKSVEIKQSHGVHGEELVILTMDVTVNVGAASERITKHQLFHTQENSSHQQTSPVDLYRFHRVVNKFSESFYDSYEEVLNKLINDQFGNGFVNP